MTTLAEADRACRRVNRRHGVTYYWAAQLLGPEQRRHVHALYALCRTADDVVDGGGSTDDRRRRLDRLRSSFDDALGGGSTDDPVLVAVRRTIETYGLERSLFERFFAAMATDLVTSEYSTWDDLLVYMDGSAAVIGEMLLPVLEPTDPAAAFEPARHLGLAFQLTNFLRDIGEDLDLGRRYVPSADVERFGVDLASRTVTPAFVDLMRFEIARNRDLYDTASDGLAVLPPRSRRCVATALRAYREILDRIEANGFDVFGRRASVPAHRKLRIAVDEFRRR